MWGEQSPRSAFSCWAPPQRAPTLCFDDRMWPGSTVCCFARVQDLEIVDQAVWALQNLLSYQAKAYGWHSSIYRLTVVRETGMLMSPSVLTKVSVTTEPRGTLSTSPIIWNLVDWNGSRRKVSFLQILQSLGEGSKPQRRERGMFYRRCNCRTTAQLSLPG